MDPRDTKRLRLSHPRSDAPAARSPAALATELAAAGDVRGLLLLESRLHAVLSQPDAACVKVVGFLRRESTCERLVHELLLFDTITASSDPERDSADTARLADQAGAADAPSLGASDAGRAAFAASCVLGGGIPEVAATLATSDSVWRSLVSALQRERPSQSVRAMSASMLERTCRSFFLRAGSRAREGFVVMAKRHGFLQVALNHQLQMPQLLSLLPLIYRHDHSPKRYAYWASLELGLQLMNRVLIGSLAEQEDDTAAGVVLREDEYACEALVGMCEWSAGDRSRTAGLPMKPTSSTHARQWGLSLLAELAEASCSVVRPKQISSDSASSGIGHLLAKSAATDCTLGTDGRQQSSLLGVRSLTAVLSLSASLRQPTSSHAHAAIALATSVAAMIPQVLATLEQLATVDWRTHRCLEAADGRAPLCHGSTDVLIQAVRFIGATSDMVASCACGHVGLAQDDSRGAEAIDPLRTALVQAHAPTVLMRLLFAAAGGTLAAPHIVTALEHVWAAPIVRDELFSAGDWWTQWCLPLLDRARLHATAGDASASARDPDGDTEILPSFGHIVTLSCLCDENGTAIEAEVSRHLTLHSSSYDVGDLPVDSIDKNGHIRLSTCADNSSGARDDRIAVWRKHMAVMSAACKQQAVADLKLAQLKCNLREQKRSTQQRQAQHEQASNTGEGAGAATGSRLVAPRSSVGVDVKRMPLAD